MQGLEKETAAFFCTFLSGCVAVYIYQILNVVRGLWKHGTKLINTEDIVYWLGISGYLFYQMYQTTYGIIRWHFILGIVAGAVFANRLVRRLRKWVCILDKTRGKKPEKRLKNGKKQSTITKID